MIPIHQTIFGEPNGNCLQACVSSIFEFSIDDVPNFAISKARWFDKLTKFCLKRGLTPLIINRRNGADGLENGWSIISGKSPRGDYNHAVVAFNGKLMHDPFSGGNCELGELVDEIVFVVIDPSRGQVKK